MSHRDATNGAESALSLVHKTGLAFHAWLFLGRVTPKNAE